MAYQAFQEAVRDLVHDFARKLCGFGVPYWDDKSHVITCRNQIYDCREKRLTNVITSSWDHHTAKKFTDLEIAAVWEEYANDYYEMFASVHLLPLTGAHEETMAMNYLHNKTYLPVSFTGRIYGDLVVAPGVPQSTLRQRVFFLWDSVADDNFPFIIQQLDHTREQFIQLTIDFAFHRGRKSLLLVVFPFRPALREELWNLNDVHQKYQRMELADFLAGFEPRRSASPVALASLPILHQLTQSENLETDFYQAAVTGNPELFAALLQMLDPQIGLKGACEGGHLNLVRAALGAGAIIDHPSISVAIQKGHLHLMDTLLAKLKWDGYFDQALADHQPAIAQWMLSRFRGHFISLTANQARVICLQQGWTDLANEFEISLSCSFEEPDDTSLDECFAEYESSNHSGYNSE